MAIPITDLVHLQTPKDIHRLERGQIVMRDPRLITSLMLHQTACVYATTAAQRRLVGSHIEAVRRRALNIRCHAFASRQEGVGAVITNDVRAFVEHGNGPNPFSLGLEIEAYVEGIAGNMRTFPGDVAARAPVTDLLVEVARAACAELVARARAAGCDMRYVLAHRQSNPARTADPGETLWVRVALEYCERELGLTSLPETVWRTKKGFGRPIPETWDPRQKGVAYR